MTHVFVFWCVLYVVQKMGQLMQKLHGALDSGRIAGDIRDGTQYYAISTTGKGVLSVLRGGFVWDKSGGWWIPLVPASTTVPVDDVDVTVRSVLVFGCFVVWFRRQTLRAISRHGCTGQCFVERRSQPQLVVRHRTVSISEIPSFVTLLFDNIVSVVVTRRRVCCTRTVNMFLPHFGPCFSTSVFPSVPVLSQVGALRVAETRTSSARVLGCAVRIDRFRTGRYDLGRRFDSFRRRGSHSGGTSRVGGSD